MSFSPNEDPSFKNCKKLNSKKRDFIVKTLKKDRLERQHQLELQQEEEEENENDEHTAPERAGRIVLVHNSYLTRPLSELNRSNNTNLPKKWQKNKAAEEEEEEDEEDEEDEDEEYDDEDDYDEDDEVQINTLRNSAVPEVDITDDDDEHEYRNTQGRIVRIIEEFNEVEFVESAENTRHSQHYKDAETQAPQSFRDRSKSPRLSARASPKATSNKTTEDPPSLDLGTPKFGAKATKELRDLEQQLEDLDLGDVLNRKKQPEAKLPLPHEDELDTGVWWNFILDHGCSIKSNGQLDIKVVDFFSPAAKHEIPESYFHLDQNRRSPPEKPLTAFGLFKQHYIADNNGENDDGKDISTKGKKGKSKTANKRSQSSKNSRKANNKNVPNDAKLKQEFFNLDQEELAEYYFLALIEKIRYKVNRVEYIYQQSTKINAKGAAKK